jgi:hypothetical protein
MICSYCQLLRIRKNSSAYAYLLADGLTLEAQQEHLVPAAYFHEFREETQVPELQLEQTT